MPTRRTPINRPTKSGLISPRCVQLFRKLYYGDEENHEARAELHDLLGRLPGEVNVMDAAEPMAPVYCDRMHDYQTAHELYLELERRV